MDVVLSASMVRHHVRRIAHLSDLHLLSPSNSGVSAGDTVRRRFVSLGRALDPEVRRRTALSAMQRARGLGAEHLVLSGDLTELGLLSEMEVMAELLWESGFRPAEITLVPGNHDRYSGGENWGDALAGCLAPWAANTPSLGGCVDLGSIRLLPVDVTRPQSVMRSAGFVTAPIVEALSRQLADEGLARAPLAVVLHHAPFALAPILHRIDGLIGWEQLSLATRCSDHVQMLHGHLHRSIDRDLGGAIPRVLGAPAVVDGEDSFRIYDVTVDGLLPVAVAAAAA